MRSSSICSVKEHGRRPVWRVDHVAAPEFRGDARQYLRVFRREVCLAAQPLDQPARGMLAGEQKVRCVCGASIIGAANCGWGLRNAQLWFLNGNIAERESKAQDLGPDLSFQRTRCNSTSGLTASRAAAT